MLYILHLTLLEHKLMKLDPALLTASIVYLCSKVSNLKISVRQLEKDFSVSPKQIQELAMKIYLKFLVKKTDKSKRNACKRKFSHEKYLKVANLSFDLVNFRA